MKSIENSSPQIGAEYIKRVPLNKKRGKDQEGMKILWVDVETTGLDPVKHGIIQMAFIVDIDGVVKDRQNFFMNPIGRSVNPKALEVVGCTETQISSYPSWIEVHKEIVKFLKKWVDPYNKYDKFLVAGQNVKFDVDFWREYWKACNDEYLYSFIKSGAYIDTLYMVTFLQWAGILPLTEKRKNEDLARLMNIELSGVQLHNAAADIELTRKIGQRMLHHIQVQNQSVSPRRIEKDFEELGF